MDESNIRQQFRAGLKNLTDPPHIGDMEFLFILYLFISHENWEKET